jgi:NAD(P)-dependent dehydrogenase (short-subunit alcohol dehydrogenase family)
MALSGQVAFITGASSGIGQVVATVLAAQGMKVVLTARRLEKLEENVEAIKAAGGEAAAFKCDVGNATSIEWAFDFAVRTYGRVDFVFVNAGIEGNLMHESHADYGGHQQLFDINVTGAAETLKYAVKVFETQGSGTIAFSSSVAAFCGITLRRVMNAMGMPKGNAISYCASKAALDMIATGAAGAYGDDGVKVYNFNLGEFATEMGSRLGFTQDEAGFNPIFKKCLGDPKYIAEVIVAILDGSSKWRPGSALCIDNNVTIDSKYFYDKLKVIDAPMETMGWPTVDELKAVACDVKGEPYDWSKCEIPL